MKIRIENDIALTLSVLRPDGMPEDLSTAKDVKVTLSCGGKEYSPSFEHNGKDVVVYFPASMQEALGYYTITLQYSKIDPAMPEGKSIYTVDHCDAFKLVPDSCEADAKIENGACNLSFSLRVDRNSWTSNHSELTNLSFEESGHTGFQPAGDYLTPEDFDTLSKQIDKKVDEVEGKGLSTEDFTTLLRQKLESLSNYDDAQVRKDISTLSGRLDSLVGISASGAIDTFNEIVAFLNGITDTSNLAVMLANMRTEIIQRIPTKTGDLQNNTDFVSDPDYKHTDNNYTLKDKDIVATVPLIDADQKNLVVEIDFPTASDVSVWFSNPVNVAKVRQGSIFRITNEEEPDFLAVFNNTARAFELKPIDKIVTKSILQGHNANITSHQPLYDKITAETNTNINRQFKDTSAQGSAVSYLRYTGGQYILSDTRPTTNENAPFALTGTTVNTKTFAGTLSKAGFFSPKASYTESIYLTGLQEQVRYTVRIVYSIKGTIVYDETRTIVGMPSETTRELNFIVPSESTYTQRINFTVGDAYTRAISISKNTTGNNHTVNIASVPASGLYSFTQRYGGVVYATDIFDETQGKTQSEFNDYILTQTSDPVMLLAYGIEWDITVSNPKCTRIGSMGSHRALPIQSKIRRCLLNDDGTVNYYLDPNDSTKKEDGSPAILDGTDGQVMVEIPDMYVRFDTDGNKRRAWMSEIQMAGFQKWNKCYVSAYEATVDRTVTATPKLASVVNLTPAYRGGGNTAPEIAHDADGGTSLGKPATNISLTNFRDYARNRGSVNWNCYTYQAHKMLFWLFAVEYATFNSQDTFNAALTMEGYRQGGLGAGVTDLVGVNITAMTGGTYACIPCGISNSLGNKSGIVSYTMPSEYGSVKTTNVPCYRGLENPFGHIWKWTDGCKALIYATTDKNVSEFYTADNPNDYSSSGLSGYKLKGLIARTNGYIKEILGGERGDIMPKIVGGGSTTYFCDNFDTNIPTSGSSERGVLFGGHATYGASAGFVFSGTYTTATATSATIGSRLCFIPTL